MSKPLTTSILLRRYGYTNGLYSEDEKKQFGQKADKILEFLITKMCMTQPIVKLKIFIFRSNV